MTEVETIAPQSMPTVPDFPLAAEVLDEPPAGLPPIAGFWRRFGAWLLDWIFLGILGTTVGVVLAPLWLWIGPYGRLFGLAVILAYFGTLNSRLGTGRTLGKRVTKIAVRGCDTQPIGLRRSLCRIGILAVPYICNGWALPIFKTPWLAWIVTAAILGIGGMTVYTMLFNVGARQGLHDLLCKTYVVHLCGRPVHTWPQTRQVHVAMGITVGVAAIALSSLPLLLLNRLTPAFPFPEMMETRNQIMRDSRFFSVVITERRMRSTRGVRQDVLFVDIWPQGWKSQPEREKIADGAAAVVLRTMPNAARYDRLLVAITSRYDLGIANGSYSYNCVHTIPEWQSRLNPSSQSGSWGESTEQ